MNIHDEASAISLQRRKADYPLSTPSLLIDAQTSRPKTVGQLPPPFHPFALQSRDDHFWLKAASGRSASRGECRKHRLNERQDEYV